MATSIHQELALKAKPKDVYSAIMDSKKHMAFTKNGAAKISKIEWGHLSLISFFLLLDR